ncbi:MAG: carboxypeptidase-like regulatory domain-containing protein [Lewinellaceae bacterium]|nr:carboxypeptidase-like regulatory domain-containing protein [Lewinellaceae bacterium]
MRPDSAASGVNFPLAAEFSNRRNQIVGGYFKASKIILFALAIFFPLLSYAQPVQKAPLRQALQQIEAQFQVSFAYDDALVEGIEVPSPDMDRELEAVLAELLEGTGLAYSRIDEGYIVLKPRPPEPLLLCGRVLEAGTDTPLPYATVYLRGTATGCSTDAEGYFELPAILGPADTLVASYVGYQGATLPAQSFAQQPCRAIRLAPTATQLASVLVKEFTIDMLEREHGNRYHFHPGQIPTLPGWGEPDLLRGLQLLPGISASDESASNLSIRGGTSDQNLLLWDGIPIYHTGHFFGYYSAINPYVAQSMDVYRGGFGAEYGARVSGVIDITGKPELGKELRYGVGMNHINLHGFMEIPIKKERAALLLALRRSYTDLIQSRAYQNIFNRIFAKGRVYENREAEQKGQGEALTSPVFHYADINAKWYARLGNKSHLSVSLYAGSDQFDYNFSFADDLYTQDQLRVDNSGLSFNYKMDWAENFTTHARLVASTFTNEYRFHYTFDPDIPFEFRFRTFNQLRDWSLQLHHDWQVHPRHHLRLGWMGQGQKADFQYEEERRDGNRNTGAEAFEGTTSALFGAYTYKVPDRLEVTLGLRSEIFTPIRADSALDQHRAAMPRFSASYYPFGKQFFFQANLGTYRQYVYQMPPFYSDLGAGEGVWVIAGRNFRPLYAGQWSLGFGYQLGRFEMEVDYYQKLVGNLSSWKVTLEEDVENPFTQDGTLRATGFDILLKHRWPRYTLWLSYSLGAVTNEFDAFNAGEPFPADNDQRHLLNFTQTLRLNKWNLSATFFYGSGKPFTMPTDMGARPDEQTGEPIFFLKYDKPNNGRLPAYHRLDLAVDYRFDTERWTGKLGLSAFNFYNRRNLFDIDFFPVPPQYNDGQPGVYNLERPMLGFTPNLFVQIEW